MSLISCGAAVECAVCAAADDGWNVAIELAPDPHGDAADQAPRRLFATLVLKENTGRAPNESWQRLIAARVTNRAVYDGSPVSEKLLEALRSAATPQHGSPTYWIADRGQIETLAQFAGRADALLFGEDSMRRAFLGNLRFDLPAGASADRGLNLGSLDISSVERLTLRALRFTPNWAFRLTPAPHMFASYSARLLRSSSGVCVVTSFSPNHALLHSGRAMLRAWLSLTRHGMGVQPMMSSIAMLQAIECGSPELIDSIGARRLSDFSAEFRAALETMGISGAPHCLMRFGRAPSPACRTGRLPLSVLIRNLGDSRQ
jgi:hypothetical protein